MFDVNNIFGKFKKDKSQVHNESSTNETNQAIKPVKNWFEERNDTITTQRNLLFLFVIILLILSVIAVAVVAYVVKSKKFDPFVIQIDNATGVAQVVNPASSETLNGDEALAKYFIKKYVVAREAYNPVDFESLSKRIIRLFSSSDIFWAYRGYIQNEENDPAIKYGQKNTTYLTLKSWSKLEKNKYMMRFSINETAQYRRVFNKIAVIEYRYVPMELKENDLDINPVGFQVIGYSVDNDDS